jgi:hypothetical protein
MPLLVYYSSDLQRVSLERTLAATLDEWSSRFNHVLVMAVGLIQGVTLHERSWRMVH